MEIEENSRYWQRIRKTIKKLYIEGKITQRYTYESFCNDFIPEEDKLEDPETGKCICDHDIKHNYEYKHKENDDYFILGSCCIKKFSTVYKEQRKCIDCDEKIKKNADNRCKDCRKAEIKRKAYQEKCKCKGCGYIKKDDKYKYCYYCNQKRKTY